MARIVDPGAFTVEGSALDWAAVATAGQHKVRPEEIARRRELTGTTVLQLRWAHKAELGYPIGPFTVWVRVRKGLGQGGVELKPATVSIAGMQLLVLDQAYAEVSVLLSDGPAGVVTASTGMPLGSRVVDLQPVTAGGASVTLRGPGIRTVTVPPGSVVDSVVAQPFATADDPAWQELELVGLPGDGRSANRTDLTSEQGLVGAPTDPVAAALDRFRRGAPFYGWDAELESGVPAPAWLLADPEMIVKVFQSQMLDDFVDMVDSVGANAQYLRSYDRVVTTPSGKNATATFNPLALLLYGALTDPLNSLVTGFGTAYDASALVRVVGPDGFPGTSRAALAVAQRRPLDVMVTGVWRTGQGEKEERAALLLGAQQLSLPPAAPSGLTAGFTGTQAPAALDGPFGAVVELGWSAPPSLLPFHLGQHALARRTVDPTGAAVSLLQARPGDVAGQPIGETFDPATPNRRSGSDTSYPIAGTPSPNVVRYGVASSDIFGRWSRWSNASVAVAEPPVGPVSLAGARLDTAVLTGPCPATLTVDLSWSWASRSPATIEVAGRLYPQVWAQDPPDDLTVPGLPGAVRTLGSGLLAAISFAPDGSVAATASGAGMTATVQHLSLDGKTVVGAPLGGRDTRRYRLQVTGFDLDFDAAGRWGLAVWAHGIEARAPGRVGAWTGTPVITSAADPRPPVIASTYEAVQLASLRDAAGEHHARLSWTPMAGAAGYRVYTVSEATFRALHAMPEPRPADTLTVRLAALRAIFAPNPDRRPFTRVGAAPVVGTSTPVVLPRGTRDIHLFLVLGVSAGEVESAWPTTADPLCGTRFVAFAAPQLVAPGPPELEVSRSGPGPVAPHPYAARLRIRSAAGATVARIDLHRVRVPAAATTLDTMGPPVATISGTAGAFTVTPIPPGPADSPSAVGAGQPVGVVTGQDAVEGSWRPVYYRAVAWGHDDADRGQYGVRSLPSVVRQVVVPPAGDPPLAAPTFVLPVAGSPVVQVDTSTTAPVAATTLGPHRVEAEVVATGPGGASTVLTLAPSGGGLEELPGAAPASGVSGLWRGATTAGSTALHVAVARDAFGTALRVRVRITDPLGRMSERVVEVPASTPVVAPDILDPVLTPVAGGTVLGFRTSVPDAVAGPPDGGPYVLSVSFGPSRGPGRPVRARADLADLTVLRAGTDLLADPSPIPLARTPRDHGLSTLFVGVRGAGRVTVQLRAPDGATAELTRIVGRRVFP